MIEETLLQYGALGVLILLLILQLRNQQQKDDERQNRLISVIENNTIAMTKTYQVIKKCRRNANARR